MFTATYSDNLLPNEATASFLGPKLAMLLPEILKRRAILVHILVIFIPVFVEIAINRFTRKAVGQIGQYSGHSRYLCPLCFTSRFLVAIIEIGPKIRVLNKSLISLYAHHRNLLVKLRSADTDKMTELASQQIALP